MSELYSIAILVSKGLSLSDALTILRSAKIHVEGAADVSCVRTAIATILLRSPEDRNQALRLLYKAGFDVQEGSAGS